MSRQLMTFGGQFLRSRGNPLAAYAANGIKPATVLDFALDKYLGTVSAFSELTFARSDSAFYAAAATGLLTEATDGDPRRNAAIISKQGWAENTGVASDAPLPWWLPKGAVLHVDFDNERFYWDGAERSLSDLSVATTSGYYLDWDLDFTDTAWVEFSVSHHNETADGAGSIFSWTSGYPGGDRVEVAFVEDVTYGNYPRLYLSPGDPAAGYVPLAYTPSGYTSATGQLDEKKSYLFRVASGEPTQVQPGNYDKREGDITAGTLSAPTRIAFGAWAWQPGVPPGNLTDATLHTVTIWNSDAAIDAQKIGSKADGHPLHLVGDSFLNIQWLSARLRTTLDDYGNTIPVTQDGVGGSSLEEQLARMSAYSGAKAKWLNSTLVIVDGGLSDTAEDAITAINGMAALLPHDRWLYLQAAPSTALSAEDIAQGGTDADLAIQAAIGDRYIPTLELAWAESDGSTADEDKVAIGQWPVSLVTSASDFHPNAAGNVFLANIIASELAGRGWIDPLVPGLQTEPTAATNLTINSNDLSSWTKSYTDSITVTNAQAAGPDGAMSLAKLEVTDTSSEDHSMWDAPSTVTSGATYIASMIVKHGDHRYIGIRMWRSTSNFSVAVFDTLTGVVTTEANGGTSGTVVDTGVLRIGGGLLLLYLASAQNGTELYSTIDFYSSASPTLTSNGVEPFAGLGGEHTYAGFYTLVAGSIPSSYIPTNGSTAPRAAETLSIPAAKNPEFADAVCFATKRYITYADLGASEQQTIVRWYDDANNYVIVTLDTDGAKTGTITLRVANGGSTATLSATAELTPGINQALKIAFAVTSTELGLALNGTAETRVSGVGVPDLSATDMALIYDGGPSHDTKDIIWAEDIGDIGLEEASA